MNITQTDFVESITGFQLTAWQREVLDRIGRRFRMNVSFERLPDDSIAMRSHDTYYLSRAGRWYRHPGPRPLLIDGAAYRRRIRSRRKR